MSAIPTTGGPHGSARSAAILAILLAAAWLLAGCAAAKLAVGKDGQDLSPIRPGITRAELETHLGKPERNWISETGVAYATYRFNKGVAPQPGWSAAAVVADVLSVGILELAFVNADDKRIYGPDDFGRLVVSFDAEGRVLGLFNEFDRLPTDGRSAAPPSVRPGTR